MSTILALAALLAAQDLTEDSLEKWRAYLTPPPEELAWRKIPWRATFWEAVVEAQEKEMPILLWAMNGHPLACT